jgi:hypothetical protein
MGVVGVFSKVQHLNPVERADQIEKLLEGVDFTPEVKATILKAVEGDVLSYSEFEPIPISIGVKKLFAVAEMSLQSEDQADTFLFSLYEECKGRPF